MDVGHSFLLEDHVASLCRLTASVNTINLEAQRVMIVINSGSFSGMVFLLSLLLNKLTYERNDLQKRKDLVANEAFFSFTYVQQKLIDVAK